MPSDSHKINSPRLWNAFGDYVCSRYQAHPHFRTNVEGWFQALYAKRGDVDLSLVDIERKSIFSLHETIRFQAFCLDGRMFISHDRFVRNIPSAIKDRYGASPDSSYIGAYLMSPVVLDDDVRGDLVSGRTLNIPVADYGTETIRTIAYEMMRGLDAPGLPGGRANRLVSKGADQPLFSITSGEYIPSHDGHRDNMVLQSEKWCRVLICPVWGTSLEYRLNSSWVPAIPHAMVSHIACDRQTGAWHCGSTRSWAVVMAWTEDQRRLRRSPWKITVSDKLAPCR